MKHMLAAALALSLFAAPPCQAHGFAERWAKRVKRFKAENARLDPNRKNVVLLGSSSTEGWKYANRIGRYLPTVGPRALNRGISGDGIGLSRTTGILNRLDASALGCRPSHIVLLNGRNSVGRGVERTAATYRRVVERLRAGAPDAVVVLVTCAPVRGRYAHLKNKIVRLNAAIKQIAADLGCELIDLHPALVGPDGLMRASVTSDGLHFKNEGYRVMGEAIERIVASGVTAPDPAPAAEPDPEPKKTATVNVRTRLNLRTGPGTSHRRIGSARNGERFEVLGRDGVWVHLRLPDGREAWAHGAYLDVTTVRSGGAAGHLPE